MKNKSASLVSLLAITVLGGLAWLASAPSAGTAQPAAVGAISPPHDAGMALLEPDRFNWTLLVSISQKAPDDLQQSVNFGGVQVQTNNAIWETWATDPFTFPTKPDPAVPPKWDERIAKRPPHQGAGVLDTILRAKRSHNRRSGVAAALGPPAQVLEIVYRNKAGFEYIVKNNLFYLEGLAKKFAASVNSSGYLNVANPISFPRDAIELKSDWAEITEPDSTDPAKLNKSNCHWNYLNVQLGTGNPPEYKLMGLVGLHLMQKTLPNWTWATFEWVGNPVPAYSAEGAPGRSDWIGSRDAFGVSYGESGSFQVPVGTNAGGATPPPSNKSYPPGTVTSALLTLFEKAGFEGVWLNAWSNYRLKGSQVDFTDGTGVPTRLGNSATEGGVGSPGVNNTQVLNASCMTCHAMGNINSAGITAHGGGEFVVGTPDPNLLFDMTSYDATQPFGNYKVINVSTDFVWAFLNAQAASKP
jgi:hypothetical protein